MKIKLFNLVAITVVLLSQSVSADITLEDIYRDTIINDVTLSVPSDYADIGEALLFLDDKRIANDVTVTIQVADGTYNNYPTIVLNHPYGSRIEIIGNTSSPGSVVLNFIGKHGIDADNGYSIGKIDGLTLVGDQTNYCNGINAYNNASVILGNNMIVMNFYCGILSRSNATVIASGITIQSCSYGGINCGDSTVWVVDALIENNAQWGLHSYRTGYIQADNAIIRNNTTGAVLVQEISLVEAFGATISGTTSVDPKGALLQ